MQSNTKETEARELPLLLGLRRLADECGVSYRQAQTWAAAGQFPIVKLGHRTVRVHRSDFLAFVESRRKGKAVNA